MFPVIPSFCFLSVSVGLSVQLSHTFTGMNILFVAFSNRADPPVLVFVTDGYYMYIETSAPRRNNDKARILSPRQTGTGIKCLTFWYHMYGSNVKTLNVYVTGDSNLGSALWSKNGTQGNRWKKATVDINLGNNQKQYNVSDDCDTGYTDGDDDDSRDGDDYSNGSDGSGDVIKDDDNNVIMMLMMITVRIISKMVVCVCVCVCVHACMCVVYVWGCVCTCVCVCMCVCVHECMWHVCVVILYSFSFSFCLSKWMDHEGFNRPNLIKYCVCIDAYITKKWPYQS